MIYSNRTEVLSHSFFCPIIYSVTAPPLWFLSVVLAAGAILKNHLSLYSEPIVIQHLTKERFKNKVKNTRAHCVPHKPYKTRH